MSYKRRGFELKWLQMELLNARTDAEQAKIALSLANEGSEELVDSRTRRHP